MKAPRFGKINVAKVHLTKLPQPIAAVLPSLSLQSRPWELQGHPTHKSSLLQALNLPNWTEDSFLCGPLHHLSICLALPMDLCNTES